MHLTYEHDYRSRCDGRYSNMLSAYRAMIQDAKPKLAFPEDITRETFPAWQSRVKDKMAELLCMPEKTTMRTPVKLGCVQRNGYRVEKWEFYPGKYNAVPALMAIPDSATAEHPVPGVFCLPGSRTSKELLAGEEVPSHPNYSQKPYPARNAQAKHMALAGYVAVAFDNPGTCECSCMTPPEQGPTVDLQRNRISFALIESGYNYMGISAFEKLCFLDWFKELPYVDFTQLAICAHSLGTQAALPLAVICDDFKAYIHNDFVCDERRRFLSMTDMSEQEDAELGGVYLPFLMCPGNWRYFLYPDLLAAVAPKYLAMNEGGAEEFTGKVLRAYDLIGAPDHVQLSHYPKYSDPSSRNHHGNLPNYGLSGSQYFDWSYVDAPDHSFRAEPSIRLLRKAFSNS